MARILRIRKYLLFFVFVFLIFIVSGSELTFPNTSPNFDNVDIGGGYISGGISLFGTGVNKGSGWFATDILIAGNITSISDLQLNGSFYPDKDALRSIGSGSLRWKDANFSGTIQVGALTVDANTLYVDSANHRVGIGTTGPGAPLEVIQPGTTGIRITGTDGTRADFTMYQSATQRLALLSWSTNMYMDWTSGGDFIFRDSLGGSQIQRVVFKGGGNVGIGNITPAALFDVNNVFVVQSAGNVGIGTTSPGVALHVVGEVNITGISGDGTGKVVCIKSDKTLGTCSSVVASDGTCTCG